MTQSSAGAAAAMPPEGEGMKVQCGACEGTGFSGRGLHLLECWGGRTYFSPFSTGSKPYTYETPGVWEIAEENLDIYGHTSMRVWREAERLCHLWNSMWQHHLSQDDVDALLAEDRLYQLTGTSGPDGWVPIQPTPVITARQVNLWSISRRGGHDSINRIVVVKAALARAGESEECALCHGTQYVTRSKKLDA